MNNDFYDPTYLVYKDGKLTRKRHPDQMVCDFCCGPLGESCWTYPCGDIELPLVTDPTGLPARSDDPWGACLECHPFIEKKDWRGLAKRSIYTQLSMLAGCSVTLVEVPEKFIEDGIPDVIAHYERFDAARNGKPFMEYAPYTNH